MGVWACGRVGVWSRGCLCGHVVVVMGVVREREGARRVRMWVWGVLGRFLVFSLQFFFLKKNMFLLFSFLQAEFVKFLVFSSSHCEFLSFVLSCVTTCGFHGTPWMECSPRRLGPDHSKTAATGRGVANGRAQCVSRSPESVCWPCAASSSGSMKPQTEDESQHSSRDGPVHCGQTRESVGGDGRRPRSCRGGSEDRVDQSQVSVEYIARGERRIKELDAQRAAECALLTEAEERFERLVHAQSRAPTVVHPPDPGEQDSSR